MCCCCENKESTYWYKYSYNLSHYGGSGCIKYVEDFITTDNFQSWWLGYKDDGDKLEMVVKL